MDDKKDQGIEGLKDKIIKILAAVGLLAVFFGVGVGLFKALPKIGRVAGSAAVFLSSQFFPSDSSTTTNDGDNERNANNADTQSKAVKPSGKPSNDTGAASAGASAPAPAASSFVDLTARVLKTGIMDAAGQFVATSSVRFGNRIAFQFEVINLGNISSGPWIFNAVLPTIPNHIFGSDTQLALRPRDKVVYTLGFDNIRDIGNQEIVVNVDPTNSIKESDENNNIVKTTVSVSQ